MRRRHVEMHRRRTGKDRRRAVAVRTLEKCGGREVSASEANPEQVGSPTKMDEQTCHK